jgi:hypothetical protein
MPLDRFEQKNIPPAFEQMEISLSSPEDLAKLENHLLPLLGDDAAEQCVFVLRSMADDITANRCHDATKEFGRGLATSFGDEESFFDLAPDAKFSDTQSQQFLSNSGKALKHHSVGLLEFNPPQGQPFALAFDLTYGEVFGSERKNAISFFHSPGTREQAMQMLKNHYGGSWGVEYEFNPQNGRFVAG